MASKTTNTKVTATKAAAATKATSAAAATKATSAAAATKATSAAAATNTPTQPQTALAYRPFALVATKAVNTAAQPYAANYVPMVAHVLAQFAASKGANITSVQLASSLAAAYPQATPAQVAAMVGKCKRRAVRKGWATVANVA